MPPRARFPSPPPALSVEQLLTTREVAGCLRVSTRTVWRYVAQGLLPEPIRLSSQKCVWPESAVKAFLQRRAFGL
jgi:predicted DNA-binding transcriptional regulator AlpA